jgi:hypothetical protein
LDCLRSHGGKHYPETAERIAALFEGFEQELERAKPLLQIPEDTEGGSWEELETGAENAVGAHIDPYLAAMLAGHENLEMDLLRPGEKRFGVKIYLTPTKILILGERAREALEWVREGLQSLEVGSRIKGVVELQNLECLLILD